MRMNTPKRSFLHGIGIKYFITAIIRKPRPQPHTPLCPIQEAGVTVLA